MQAAHLPIFISLLSIFRWSAALKETPVIQTKLGPVRGEVLEVGGIEIYHFGSIPYAEPMVGNLRYRKTVPKNSWTEILKVGPPPNECFQDGHGDEDCLKVAVWVKKSIFDKARNQNYTSVYSYIHGGGFVAGSIKSTGDLVYIAAYNDLVVTAVQYRLGSLGFAYLGTEDVPGNMGLWDQLEAMKWIRDNIETFGGNNKEITILGESAGGASVTLHQLSPYSRRKGLYRSAIAQSGSALCVWATHSKEFSFKTTNIVFDINCPQQAIDAKLKCLRALDPFRLTLHDRVGRNMSYAGLSIGPVVDGDFLPRDPISMLSDGDFEKVPMIVSTTRDEGTMFVNSPPLAEKYLPTALHPDRLQYHTYEEYQFFFHERFHFLTDNVPLLLQTIELQYWPRNHEGYPKGPEVFDAVEHAESDYAFSCPSFHWGKRMSIYVDNVFAFYYTHRLKNHPWAPEWMGVTHADDLAITDGHTFNPANTVYTDEDRQLSRKVMAYFTNFVKYSDPNGRGDDPAIRHWPPLVGKNCSGQYFEINAKTLLADVATTDATICDLKARECFFWQDFVPKQIEAVTSATNERRTTPKPINTALMQAEPSILVPLISAFTMRLNYMLQSI